MLKFKMCKSRKKNFIGDFSVVFSLKNNFFSMNILLYLFISCSRPDVRCLSSGPPQPKYDVCIVGGGHNGLVAAAYLAKAGLATAVFERRHLVGNLRGEGGFSLQYRG